MNKYMRPVLREGIGEGGDGGGDGGTTTAPEPIDFSSEETFAQFRSSLPEDLQGHQLFQETKNFQSLAEQSIHAQSALGKKRLEAPAEDWDDARWSDFHKQFAPEDPASYELPEKLELSLGEDQEAVEYSLKEETAAELKSAAQRLNLSPAQAKELARVWAEKEYSGGQDLDGQIKQTVSTQINELRSQWGDQFDVNHRAANEAYDALAQEVPELKQLMEWSPVVSNHPATMKLFHRLAPLVKDLGVASGTGRMGSGFEGNTVASIDAEISDVMSNPLISADPRTLSYADQEQRQRLIAQRSALYRKKYGE